MFFRKNRSRDNAPIVESFLSCLVYLELAPVDKEIIVPVSAKGVAVAYRKALQEQVDAGVVEVVYDPSGVFGLPVNSGLSNLLDQVDERNLGLTDAAVEKFGFNRKFEDVFASAVISRKFSQLASEAGAESFSDFNLLVTRPLVESLSLGESRFCGKGFPSSSGNLWIASLMPRSLVPLANLGLGRKETLESFAEEIFGELRLWRALAGWNPNPQGEAGIGFVREFARQRGIDSHIEAFLDGVQVEDLL